MIDAVLIAGPTASGKSAVAMALAAATGGAIINADSMQVYRELRILSARPTETDERAADHRLFGFTSALQPFSVALWLAEVRRVLDELRDAGRLAIVTGGTGLYFKALTQGLAEAPGSDPDIRARSRQRRAALGVTGFHQELVRLDPASALLSPGDTQRVLRAWEVVVQSGRGLSSWKAEQTPVLTPEQVTGFVLEVPRPALNARIDARFDAMMAEGALDEARAFWGLRPSGDLPAAKALGLPQLKRVVDGAATLEEAVAEAKMMSRRYAKRQGTWFRHQAPDWMRLDVEMGAAGIVASILRALGK